MTNRALAEAEATGPAWARKLVAEQKAAGASGAKKRRETSRRKWKQDAVAPVVRDLWPNRPPKEKPTAVLLQQLGDELERRKIRASLDTQRRALGRR